MGGYEVSLLAEGLGFVEGPVWTHDGRLKVVDVRGGTILDIDPASGESRKQVYTGGGPNGLALSGDTMVVAVNRGFAWHDGDDGVTRPRIGVLPKNPRDPGIDLIGADGEVLSLYKECDGRPLLAPNDLVLDGHGGFYFTDIGRAFDRTLDPGGLYYGKLDGTEIRELVHSPVVRVPLNQPNGVGLSPDGKTVYVTETQMARVWAWDVVAPGVLNTEPSTESLNGARLLFRGEPGDGFDSMAVDREGYLCVGTLERGGITVIAPDGELETYIPMPIWDQFVTNICFGGPDLRTAFVTSAGVGKVWTIKWPRPGLALAI
jgi:gluconolactonase